MATNNFFSNANPAQNALNNMNPKNIPYPGFNQQTPQPNGVTLPGAKVNTGYTVYPTAPSAPKTPTVTNTGTNGNIQNNSNTNSNTGTNNKTSPFPNPTSTIPSVTKPAQYSPQSYADQLQNAYTNLGQLEQKRGILSQAPLGQFNVGSRADDVKQYQSGLLAAESKPYEQQINAANIGLQASLPKTIGPTDYAYNPLGGAQGANEGAGNVLNRVFNKGIIDATQSQGSQSAQYSLASKNIGSILGNLGQGNDQQITALNSLLNQAGTQFGDQQLASFKANLGAVANQISSINPSLAKTLTDFSTSGFGSQNVQTIINTLSQAQDLLNQYSQNAQPGGQGGQSSQQIPTNPQNNQTWTAPDGKSFIFSNGAWHSFKNVGGDTNQAVIIPESSHLAFVNNNPGNLRFAGQPGAVEGKNGFAKFESPQAGYNALIRQLTINSGQGKNLARFAFDYAPPSENDTNSYLSDLMKLTGASWDTPLNKIDIHTLAKAIAKLESSTQIA